MATVAQQADRQNYIFAALAYLAKKRTNRDQLTVGKTTISGKIEAQVGRAKPIRLPFSGTLHVADDQKKASSSGPDTAHLLALCLAEMAPATRYKILHKLPEQFAAKQQLPSAEQELQAQAKHLLERLRSQTQKTTRGSVTFEPDPD